MSDIAAWSCGERDRKKCRNAHGCHCSEIASLMARNDEAAARITRLRAEVERLFAGADTVSPEELEQLIADKSANRAADEIISKYDVRRRG